MILTNNYIIPLILLLSIIILYLGFLFTIVIIVEKTRFDKRIKIDKYIKDKEFTQYKNLKREDFFFYSKNNKLIGYKYYNNNSKKVLIFVNGYHTSVDNYLSEINLLVSLGYNVYCFDNTGTGMSEGKKFGGVPQSIIDLQYCIKEVSKQNPNEKITFVGHSMGGYAVSNIANLDIDNIDKIIAIAPFNNIVDVVYDNIKRSFGKNLFLYKIMHKIYLKVKYKNYASYSTFNTVKYINHKILIIHGEEDKTVKVDNCIDSMMCNINTNVRYLILENKGHQPLLSSDAINYNLYLKHNISDLQMKYGKNIPDDEIQKLNKNINYNLKNQFDNDVIDAIKQFLKEE